MSAPLRIEAMSLDAIVCGPRRIVSNRSRREAWRTRNRFPAISIRWPTLLRSLAESKVPRPGTFDIPVPSTTECFLPRSSRRMKTSVTSTDCGHVTKDFTAGYLPHRDNGLNTTLAYHGKVRPYG